MFDEDTMPDWMRTMRGVASTGVPAPAAAAGATPSAAPAQAPPSSTAPQFIPVPEGLPPDANQVLYLFTTFYSEYRITHNTSITLHASTLSEIPKWTFIGRKTFI